jgi:hypothetical protein
MQNYEIRKHYEAALNSLAIMHGFEHSLLRDQFKRFLIQKKLIVRSTTELSEDSLKELADKMTRYHENMVGRSQEEIGLLKFDNILSINLTKNESKGKDIDCLPRK